jgi:hypothetical protein
MTLRCTGLVQQFIKGSAEMVVKDKSIDVVPSTDTYTAAKAGSLSKWRATVTVFVSFMIFLFYSLSFSRKRNQSEFEKPSTSHTAFSAVVTRTGHASSFERQNLSLTPYPLFKITPVCLSEAFSNPANSAPWSELPKEYLNFPQEFSASARLYSVHLKRSFLSLINHIPLKDLRLQMARVPTDHVRH